VLNEQGLIVIDPVALNESDIPEPFVPTEAAPPQKEPFFGTPYWCQALSPSLLQKWVDFANPQLPAPNSMLALPPPNPYIPHNFDLKPLPPSDCHHPLLNCSIKLQIAVGKRKVRTSFCMLHGFRTDSYTVLILYSSPYSNGSQRQLRGSTALRIKFCCPMKMRMKNGTKWTHHRLIWPLRC
jgi:Middle or third domain of peptidase_M16